MKLIILISIAILTVRAFLVEEEWKHFKLKHGKSYKRLMEEKRRYAIFQHSLKDIQEHNTKYAEGRVTYWKAVTKFADLTQEEFKNFLTLRSKPKSVNKDFHIAEDSTDLKEVNYVQQGLVTPVRDQGKCGCCWAISTAGSVEGQYAKKTGSLIPLSPQDLVDCSTNEGCGGGVLDEALEWISNHGIATEEEYPYTSHNGSAGECKHKPTVKITGYKVIDSEDEKTLQHAVLTVGPISVAIDATYLKLYGGGVVDKNSGCNDYWMNHGVLIVGIGKENGTFNYLVKNSWGPEWGMNGYFKLKCGENTCGVANDAVYPLM